MFRWGIVTVLASLHAAACTTETADRSEDQEQGRELIQVVARVDGRPIGAADVAARMRADAVDARTALDALIDEELLVQEAERQGFVELPEDRRTAERIMVRSMLRDFEEELSPESITAEEVQADFDEHGEKLQILERRDSWHILVREPGEEGRALAESILRELRGAEDPRAVFDRYAGDDAPDTPFKVKAEDLPAITRKARIEDPYKDALFAAESEGVLEEVVKTSYGWHAIVLTEITPGERRTVQDLDGEIRERLSQKKRFERLVETVESLEARGLVHYNEASIERLLAMKGLPERARD